MKLDIEELKRLEIEMEEAELMKEWMWAQMLEHEDSGCGHRCWNTKMPEIEINVDKRVIKCYN